MATAPDRLDRAGAALAALSIAWTGVSSLAAPPGARAVPVVALQGGVVATYVAARVATARLRPLVPFAAVAATASALVLVSVLPSLDPLSPPLGYANADAALYVLVAVAACMVAAAFPPGPAAGVALPVAAAFAVAAVASGSVTGGVVLALGVAALVVAAAGTPRAAVGIAGVVVLASVAATAGLGVARAHGQRVAAVEDRVDTRRVVLWRDAAVIAHTHPWTGAGPGRFQVESPTAMADADARWAHSGFLQQAAEQGAPGMALLLAAFGWAFARLWWSPPDATTVLGAVAIAALGVHAALDWVLHVAAVPLAAAALAGAATARRPPPAPAGPGSGSPG